MNIIQRSKLETLDFEKLNLKCGLEIHQQLDTGKLFCSCPCEIIPNNELDKSIERELRFSLSETGEIDHASLMEFRKKKHNIYKFNDKIACLIDLDEEPPKNPNPLALNTALRVAIMLDMTIFDKIQFMRKVIIDGSVTSGFQRTALLGVSGKISTEKGEIGVLAINLEEDSCRTIERLEKASIFSLDRQGIPLIEISTKPDMKTPEQIQEVALKLGNILRSFKETRRGLGTIRQDLNISIMNGARVEIKGAQNLKLIPKIVEDEVKRQIMLINIGEYLEKEKISLEEISKSEIFDLTQIFTNTQSKVILSELEKDDGAVLGLKLRSYKGILKTELQDDFRFASEISERVKMHFPTIKGLFHSDELPNYGITEKEIKEIEKLMKLGEKDAFCIIANKKKTANLALNEVKNILQEISFKVPSEVRQVDPKGTRTKYLRPMPSSARMYPETDIQDIIIEDSMLKTLKSEIPEDMKEKILRISSSLQIDEGKTETLLSKFEESEIIKLIEISGKNASSLYSIIFDIPKDIKKREGIEPLEFKLELLGNILKIANTESLSLNSIRDIFISLYKDGISESKNLREYLEDKNLLIKSMPEEEVLELAKKVIDNNPSAPFGALVGLIIKESNARADGRIISKILNDLFQKR